MSSTYQHVEDFVRRKLCEPMGGLKPTTRLEHDIKISGLDGKAFMEAYAREFNVDMEGFDWVEYFGSEGLGCLPLWPFHWLYLKPIHPDRLESPRFPQIKLADLTEWADAGRWSPPRDETRAE